MSKPSTKKPAPAPEPEAPAADLKVHVCHDIETLAKNSAVPVLLSLGAVKFTAAGVVERFHVRIDPADCQRYGLEIEADTVEWWMEDERQPARAQLATMGKVDLFAALDGYFLWIAQTGLDQLGSAWSMGSNFDNAKLKSICQKIGLEWPFSYKQEECCRTIKNRYPDVEFTRQGIHHGALDDAMSQAMHLIAVNEVHGINL